MIVGMDHPPSNLETYREREHQHAAGTILNVLDDGDLTYQAAHNVMRHLHYDGWRRRHQIPASRRDQAEHLPDNTLIRTATGELWTSYYRADQGYTVWWQDVKGEHRDCPSRSLDYPITVLDTP